MQEYSKIAVLTQTKNRGKTLAFQVQQMIEQDC